MTYNDEVLDQVDDGVAKLKPVTKMGTVVEVVSATRAMVAFEGSAVAVRLKVFGGVKLAAGDRVGLVKFGTDWVVVGSFTPRHVIARGRRTTDSTAAAAAQGVLRLDNVPVVAGRQYVIYTGTLIVRSSVAGDRAAVVLRYTTDGTAATTTSALLTVGYTNNLTTTGDGNHVVLSQVYVPAENQTLSIILTTQRQAGTGNISLATQGSFTIDLVVEDVGLDVGDTGVDL